MSDVRSYNFAMAGVRAAIIADRVHRVRKAAFIFAYLYLLGETAMFSAAGHWPGAETPFLNIGVPTFALILLIRIVGLLGRRF